MTWLRKIKTAEKNKGFTLKDKDDASNWCNCAVGEIADIKAPGHHISDLSVKAVKLGEKFAKYVGNDDVRNAKKTYEKIVELKE